MPLPDLLRPVLDDPARACVLCDFDGTISAIVGNPADAVALPGALDALEQLAGLVGCVGVISGRPVAWLARQLAPIAGAAIELHGMYGLETWSNGEPVSVAEAAPWREVIDGIAVEAIAAAPPTVLVEPKGLSVGLHYRARPADEAWVMAWANQQAQVHGVSLLTGRLAVELRPPIERDKGHAAAELLERHRPEIAVFLGDDTGDVPVAVALADYAARHDAHGVVICVASEETPDDMRAVADMTVPGPEEAVALLLTLAADIRGTSGS